MPEQLAPARSEDVDELLAQIPGWTLRWGVTLMFGVVLLLLGLAWFVKYPDVIKGKITITTNTPPATIVARSGGPIHLLVPDKTLLTANEAFAIIGGTARYDDVLTVRRSLEAFGKTLDRATVGGPGASDSRLPDSSGELRVRLELGELQAPYNALLLRWKEWQALEVRGNSNQQRKSIVNEQIGGYEQIGERLTRQLTLLEQEYRLLLRTYETRYKPLARSGSISTEQLEVKRDELIGKTKAIEAAHADISENDNRIIGLRSQKAEYDFDQTDRQLAARNGLRDAFTGLLNAITAWENTYVLKSPIAGRLNYLNFMHENSVLVTGQDVAGIVPTTDPVSIPTANLDWPADSSSTQATTVTAAAPTRSGAAMPGQYIGELFIEPAGSGKVAVGQVVNITLLSFGKKEYGMLRGRVASVADISTTINAGGQPQSVYKLYVALPKGLTTTVNKTLPFRYGLEGTAEVITKDIRVVERIFENIRSVVSS